MGTPYKERCWLLEMPLLATSLQGHQNLWLKAFLLDHRAYLFRVIFQLELHIFTDGLRMTVPFCSNFCCLVPKQNKKKYFKCFCKTIVTSEHPFSSQHLLWKRVAVRTQFFSLWVLHVCPKGYFTAPLKKVLSSFARLTANQKLPSCKWQVAMTSPGDQQNVDRCA